MLPSKIKGTKTAKIRVIKEHAKKAKDPALWPIYSRVKDWDFDAKKNKRAAPTGAANSKPGVKATPHNAGILPSSAGSASVDPTPASS